MLLALPTVPPAYNIMDKIDEIVSTSSRKFGTKTSLNLVKKMI